jgi:hypothetical protein
MYSFPVVKYIVHLYIIYVSAIINLVEIHTDKTTLKWEVLSVLALES